MSSNLADKKVEVKELIEALGIAKTILDYCGGGDAWERSCTEDMQRRFYDICEKYLPKEESVRDDMSKPVIHCGICDMDFEGVCAYNSHIKHSQNHKRLLSYFKKHGYLPKR
jgi:gamma-glutamylcysteine synthetase